VNDAHGNLLELNQYIPAAFRCRTWGAASGSAKAASPTALESSQAVASNNRVSGAISHLLGMVRSFRDVCEHHLAGDMATACVRADAEAPLDGYKDQAEGHQSVSRFLANPCLKLHSKEIAATECSAP
jgi:hypothetical protein